MKRSIWGVLIAASVLGLSVLGGCGKASSPPALGGETHWLEHCDGGFDCGSGLECLCGFCTSACTEDASCSGNGAGAVCAELAATAYAEGCESTAPQRLCVASSDVVPVTAAAPAPDPAPDRAECGDRLFNTDVGCLNCSDVRKDLQILRDELQAQYSGSCSRDEDCVFAAAGTGCDEGCGAAVLIANVAAYDRDLERLDRSYCQEDDKWRAQCGTHAPDCSQTFPRCNSYFATCYAGQPPTPCSERVLSGCEADGRCSLAQGSLFDERGQCFPAQSEPIACVPLALDCTGDPVVVLDTAGHCHFVRGCIPEGFQAAPPDHPCSAALSTTCANGSPGEQQ